MQATVRVFEGDRHAVDLGLDPQPFAAGHPGLDGFRVELVQPGMRQRVGERPGAAGEGLGERAGRFGKALAPQRQAGAGLVVELVRHRTAALAMVGVVPLAHAPGERRQFGAGRLPPEERARVKLVVMLGPSTFAELEVHAIDIFTSKKRDGTIATEDAVRATGGATPMLCVHGTEEHDSLCPHLADLPWVKDVSREGGHRLHGDDAGGLVRQILDAAGP